MSTATELPEGTLPANTSSTNLVSGRVASAHFRRAEEPVDAVPTPLDGWNRHCRDEGGGVGLARGWYSILAGATGHGKSLMALNMAATAMGHGESVGFVSLEMSTAQLATRLYAILTGEPVRELEPGDSFRPETASRVARAVEELREDSGVSFHVNREPIFDLHDVTRLMRYWREEKGVGFFVVDYLQLISTGDAEKLYREVTRISHRVRTFAKRTRSVVVGLSQLNRQTSADRGQSPIAQGLIGSSSLENDGDQVLLLDHSRYARDGVKRHLARTYAILAKNRHGSTGTIPIEWDYSTLRVREGQPDEERLWPERRGR